jgi:hypothetical protein
LHLWRVEAVRAFAQSSPSAESSVPIDVRILPGSTAWQTILCSTSSAASFSAFARPMPEAAPVTMADLPFSRM